MPPRSTWKGFIRLSLVSVPVRAFTSTASGSEVRLNQLHDECNSRIQYKKVCPVHGDVSNDQIVSGYEYSKGSYVKIDPEEIQKLRKKSDKAVNIEGFISPDAIDPIYYSGRTYYLAPDGAVGQKPYALLRECMVEENLYGLARVIISNREQVVILRPKDNLITMTLLTYQNKIKGTGAFEDEINEADFTPDEMKLTKTLVEASTLDDFDFGSYTDDYVEKLTELIELKVEGKEIVAAPDVEEPKIINLMEALKESVAKAQDKKPGDKKPAAKKTAKKATKKAKASKKMAARGERTTAQRKRKSG